MGGCHTGSACAPVCILLDGKKVEDVVQSHPGLLLVELPQGPCFTVTVNVTVTWFRICLNTP
jgi:hypothetical protein